MRPTLPLIILTLAQGLAMGVALTHAAETSLIGASGGSWWELSGVALGLALVGGTASFFHMHRRQAARYILRRLKTSWLSREALTTAFFGVGLTVMTLWGLGISDPGWVYQVGLWVTAFLGLVAVWVTAMLYASIPAMMSWHTPLTVLSFLVLGLLSGSALDLAVLASDTREHGLLGVILTLALGAGVVKNLHWQVFRLAKSRLRIETAVGLPRPPYRLQDAGTGKLPYRTQTQVWPTLSPATIRRLETLVFVLLVIVPIGFGIVAWTGHNAALWVLMGSVLAGSVAERWLFFADATHSSQVFFTDVGADALLTGGPRS